MKDASSLSRPPPWFFAKNQLQADVVKNMQDEHAAIDRMQERRFQAAREQATGLMAKTMQSWDSLSDHLITNSLRPGSPAAIDRIRRARRRRSPLGFFLSLFHFSS